MPYLQILKQILTSETFKALITLLLDWICNHLKKTKQNKPAAKTEQIKDQDLFE